MAQKLAAHLKREQLRERYHTCTRSTEQTHWHALLLKSEGHSAKGFAAIVHRHPDSIRALVRRYNAEGVEAVRDKRQDNSRLRPSSEPSGMCLEHTGSLEHRSFIPTARSLARLWQTQA